MIIHSQFSEPYKRTIKRALMAYAGYHGEHEDIVRWRNNDILKKRCHYWIYNNRGLRSAPCIIHTDVGPVLYTPKPNCLPKDRLAELKEKVA